MLSFDELAGTLRTTKDRVLQGVARSPGEDPQGSNTSSTQSNVPRQSGTASQGSMLPSSRRDMGKGGREDENAS